MAGLKFALGLIPKTSKVEESDLKLRKEFEEYREIENSNEMNRYLKLEKEVNSPEFEAKKKEIKNKKFKDTEEYAREQEYKKLEKSKSIKNYFKVKDSQKLANYKAFLTSDLIKRIQELEKYIKTDAIAKAKANLSPKEYKKSEERTKEKEYRQLIKSPRVKRNRKFENSKAYQEYKRVDSSEELSRYKELKEYINTEKFKEFKNYMNLSAKKRYELSNEHKKEVEYKELKESQKIKWYFKTQDKYPFGEIEKWELVFEDNFEKDKPDQGKWMFRYINGDKLIDKPYVLADDIHAFTDGKNIEIQASHLSIITRQEKAKSMTWSPMLGFTEKEFDYTSDLLSSAKGYNTKYGLYKAKVKLGSSGVTQAFSLMSDQMVPHIDVFKLDRKKLYAGNFWKNGKGVEKSQDKTSGGRYTKDYYIYSLEWSPDKLTWKINDVTFKEQSRGIPEQDMHMVFNASLKENAKLSGIPSKMEIDWVRVYDKKKGN